MGSAGSRSERQGRARPEVAEFYTTGAGQEPYLLGDGIGRARLLGQAASSSQEAKYTVMDLCELENLSALRQGLRELGFVEGQTFVIDRSADGRAERFSDLADELVQLKVDLTAA